MDTERYIIAGGSALISILLMVIGFFIVRFFRRSDTKEDSLDLIIVELRISNGELKETVGQIKELVETIKDNSENLHARVLRAELDIIGAGIANHVKESNLY